MDTIIRIRIPQPGEPVLMLQFPKDLTDQESALGFQLREIRNPEAQPNQGARRARAVVYSGLGDSERIIKVFNPNTQRIEYQRQVHGVWEPQVQGDLPSWKVVGIHVDPAHALTPQARQSDLTKGNRHIVPSPPAIERQHGAP